MEEKKCKTPGSYFIFQHSPDTIAFAFKAPFDLEIDEEEALELEEKIYDFIEELMQSKFNGEESEEKDSEDQENNAHTTTVQPYYKTKGGKPYTATEAVKGWKPTGKQKGNKSPNISNKPSQRGKSENDLVRNWRPKGKQG